MQFQAFTSEPCVHVAPCYSAENAKKNPVHTSERFQAAEKLPVGVCFEDKKNKLRPHQLLILI